jgi:putative phage-type endonuclease
MDWGERLNRIYDFRREVTTKFEFGADPRVMSRTEEWYRARRGRCTASKRAEVIHNGPGRQWETMLREIEWELAKDYKRESYSNAAMDWGNDLEAEAMANAEIELGEVTYEPGFILHPQYAWAGATPDFYVGDDITGQIKCPYKPENHLKYIYGADLPPTYYYQVQWEAWCSQRKKIVFMSYEPRQPLATRFWIKHLDADMKVWDIFEQNLAKFKRMVDGDIAPARAKLVETVGIPELF